MQAQATATLFNFYTFKYDLHITHTLHCSIGLLRQRSKIFNKTYKKKYYDNNNILFL